MPNDRSTTGPRLGPHQSEHAARAQGTYASAADHYLAPALSFWDRWGSATVDRLPLRAGQSVLDLCCGAGASALPAARRVGPAGSVLAMDLAEPLLDLARQRAGDAGLRNLTLRRGDATNTGLADGAYDAVVCVFGVFFAADMAAFVAEMWRLVRPSGTLAITTWGPDWCEPAASVFWESVRRLEPSLYRSFNPWDTITTGTALSELLARGGVRGPRVEATSGAHCVLDRPEDFWDIVLGSGFRGTVDLLDDAPWELLREQVVGEVRSRRITQLRNDVVFSTAVK
jgi:ubiquinone/menaquinone biosynthesis C-methylase UbiE